MAEPYAANSLGPPEESSSELVRAALAGDRGAYDKLVQRYFGTIYAIGYARLGDGDLANDLAQETLLRAYLCLADLGNAEAFPAWISQIARNLAADWQRRGALRSRIAPMIPLEEGHETIPDPRVKGVREKMEHEENTQEIQRAIGRLPIEQREVVLLHYVENLTFEEIGRQMGVHRSSVSRVHERALKGMRSLLTGTFRDSVSQLRAPAVGAARTMALVGTIAGLSASQKSALAAAAAVGIGSTKSAVLGTTGAGGIGALKALGLLIAMAFIGGGAIYILQGRGGLSAVQSPRPSQVRLYDDWNELARDYISQHPENRGFAKLVEALAAADPGTILQRKPALDAVISKGWEVATPQFKVFMADKDTSKAVGAAFAAADLAPFTMPPDAVTTGPNNKTPLFKLMLVSARMAEGSGNLDDAVQQALATLRLGEVFWSCEGQYSYSKEIGLQGQIESTRMLASLLANPRLSNQTAETALAGLQNFEATRKSYAKIKDEEAREWVTIVRRLKTDPSAAPEMQRMRSRSPQTGAILDGIPSLSEFEEQADRVRGLIVSDFQKPYWERAHIYGSTVTFDDCAKAGIQSCDATPSDSVLAEIAICKALASLRAGKRDLVANIPDPFAAQPITVTADTIYSLGPDATDQQGAIPYDPTNGVNSSGDIVARRALER